MTRDEMLNMLKSGANPLEVSIRKWQDVISGDGMDLGADNCALCEVYDDCEECQLVDCNDENSPYSKWFDHYAERHGEFNSRGVRAGFIIRCSECTVFAEAILEKLQKEKGGLKCAK